MAHLSQPSQTRVPLGDLTNTYQIEGLQKESTSNDRKRQREKEHYAAMSRERKDERNRKQCERRMMKKALAGGNQLGQVHVPMEEDDDNECLQNGQLTEHYQHTSGDEVLTNTESNVQGINDSCIDKSVDGDVDGDDDNEWLHRGQLTRNNEKIACGDVMINSENNGEAINDSCIDTTIDSGIRTIVDGGVTQTYPLAEGTMEACNEGCTQTQPSVVDEPDSMPPCDFHRYPCQDGDENIVFDEDEEKDEGFLFAGQE